MTHGSLFSGIGGFDLAASWMGWTNVFQCEKDEWCRKVLEKNFHDVNRYSDIKVFNAKEYEGQIDIISGGFPCQPFSVAGNQLSEKDDRYLWPEMLRVIREVKPTFVVCENVPGIIKLALDTVLSDLEYEGYTTETFIIPACAKNAWHRRDRVWIIAHTSGERFKKYWQSLTVSEKLLIPRCDSWWETEPGMGRVVDGLPNRVDRIRGLGNAIVPQVAYEIFKVINEIYNDI